jgi:hypothetical protein
MFFLPSANFSTLLPQAEKISKARKQKYLNRVITAKDNWPLLVGNYLINRK